MNKVQRAACLKLLSLFMIDGVPADQIATEGQIQIFFEIVFRINPRVEIITPTQYGKSLFVALACVIVTCIQKEMVAIVAPTNEKAKIIMRYFIDHLGDNVLFYSQLEKDTKLERLRMEESKERIILKNRGGIFVLSVQAGNSKKGVEAAMGMGAKNVIQDESALIPDDIESTIFRMIAGKGPEAFYCKIGNPFYRNHFHRSWNDPTYEKVFIDYKQGVKEGRYTEAFINEARGKPHFDILFECKFPPPEARDKDGYSPMFFEEEIKRRTRKAVQIFGWRVWGVDVAAGGSNRSVITERGKNAAKKLFRGHTPDIMSLAGIILNLYVTAIHKPDKIYIDKVGVGKGLYDRLKEFKEISAIIVGVSGGEKAEDSATFFNKRAEMFWRTKEWLPYGELEGEEWIDLVEVRQKPQSDRTLKIKSKEEMFKDGVESPDDADSLSLTFYDRDPVQSTYKPKKHVPESKYEGTVDVRKVDDDITDDELARM